MSKEARYHDDDQDVQPYKIHSHTLATGYNIYLDDHIDHDSFAYTGLYKKLGDVSQYDKVLMHLSCYGGDCHTGSRIAHAMRLCKAPVTVFVNAPCYSMGAILALSGSNLIMVPGSHLMFHNYTATQRGKGKELQDSTDEYKSYFRHLLEYFCTPFLTQEEVDRIVDDKDVYIHEYDKDLKKRIKRHFEVSR